METCYSSASNPIRRTWYFYALRPSLEPTYNPLFWISKKSESINQEMAEIELAFRKEFLARTYGNAKKWELFRSVSGLLFKNKDPRPWSWSAIIAFAKKDELLVEKWGSSPINRVQFFDSSVLFRSCGSWRRKQCIIHWKNKTDLYSYVQRWFKELKDHLWPSYEPILVSKQFSEVIDAGRAISPFGQKKSCWLL